MTVQQDYSSNATVGCVFCIIRLLLDFLKIKLYI